jgi:cytochrome d ubiquinol oxidase subunit II
MTLAESAAIILWIGITLYAVLAGADFGAGLWDLLAGGSRRGARPRALIDLAIGPVWEVNHVWLVFCLVMLWTAFPTVFSSIMLTLYVPLGLAAVGIVLRGSGFAYRHVTTRFAARRAFGAVFAVSSLITPFFLGAVLGAIAGGRVPLGGDSGSPISSWLNIPGVFAGVLAVVASAYLAAVYLVGDAHRHGDAGLVAYFRVRAAAAGAVTGLVALTGLLVARDDIPELFDGLTGRAAPLVVVSAVCGLTTMVFMWREVTRFTRVLAAAAVASIVWAWGLAQQPWMLPDQITVIEAAASPPTLWAILLAVGLAGIVIVPALALLWRLDQASALEIDDLDDEALANRG